MLRESFPLLTVSRLPTAMPPPAAPQPAQVTHVAAAPAAEAAPQDVYRKKHAVAAAKAGGDTSNSSQQLQQSLQGRLFEVSSQELRLTDQVIGKGSFCSVVKGIFNGAVVAVKAAAQHAGDIPNQTPVIIIQHLPNQSLQAISEQVIVCPCCDVPQCDRSCRNSPC